MSIPYHRPDDSWMEEVSISRHECPYRVDAEGAQMCQLHNGICECVRQCEEGREAERKEKEEEDADNRMREELVRISLFVAMQ
jgi:hypothetical protein